MLWASSLPRWLATTAAGLFLISTVAALGTKPPSAPEAEVQQPLTAQERPPVPLFAKTEPAANKAALILIPDETGLRGWVAGDESCAGQNVTIRAGNKNFQTAVRADQTFAWEHTSAKPLPVVATLPARNGNKALTARATLPAKPQGARNTAFVITDRSAYRPGHTLKFVAYLHTTTDGIEFTPLANQDFVVDLVSETRQTRATRLKLHSDTGGRVHGEYKFSDADALDFYGLRVMAEGSPALLEGTARVLLGEYRKTKVGLKLKGAVKDGKLVVTFDARDYLDREVRGTSATWSAVVTKAADVEKLALDPTKFVAHEGGPPAASDFDALPEDERLLTLANGVSAMSFAGFGARTIATREGKAEFAADRPHTAEIDLRPAWLKGQHSVTVTATFLDETGRENTGVGTFPLAPKGGKSVNISTPKELYTVGEKVPVDVRLTGLGGRETAATTVIVVKLDASPASPWVVTPQFGDRVEWEAVSDNTRLPALGSPLSASKGAPAEGWKAQPVFDPVKRTVQTAIPVVNGKADIDLKQPGAYKLLAVSRLSGGEALQSETGVVVKAPAKLPGVVLHLDAREIPAGGKLTGTVHTKFAGAKLLLTLRDAAGVQLVKPLTAGANGVVRFEEQLPANLRYGCAVCVQYPESPTHVHADQRDLYVVPTDRTLTVTTTVPDTVGPGAEVKLGLQVNREEEVDLVVSVFDESLLGVSGDLSSNIRNRFLADIRGQGRAARDLTATRLGAVTIAELVAKAEKLLEDKSALAKEPGLADRLTNLVGSWAASGGPGGRVSASAIITLVRLAGFEVYVSSPSEAYHNLEWRVPKSARLADVLHRDGRHGEEQSRRYYLSATIIDNVVLLGVASRNGYDPWVGHRGNFYQGPCYGFACGGFQQFGGICGGFNCGGLQFSGMGISGFGSYPGGFGSPIYGSFGFGGYPGGFGGIAGFAGGIGGIQGGIGGGIGGFGGGIQGGFAGAPNSAIPSVAGFQGGFSYPAVGGNAAFSPFVGGQMGMSFGYNRDFGGGGPIGGPLPGLGVGEEVVRRDFADSAFWSAQVRTDKTGKATATFKLPDSLTNWRVQVTAVSSKMHVGTSASTFKTSRPVMIWPMLPRAFAAGDTVSVFGTVHNLSDQEQNVRVHLTAENGQVLSPPERVVKVPAKGNVPVYWTYKAGKAGMTDLLMSAKCDAGADASLKKLPVVPATVPERVTASGIVGKEALKLTVPEGFDPKTAQVTVTIAPTLAADLADTLPYLVEYPYGCVEQTMSRFLPALRVAAILKQSGISTVKQLEEKLPKVVESGQKRLIELQQPDGGWGWQGNGQTHEMMTPYALFGLLAAEDAGYPCPNPATIDRGMARLREYLGNTAGQWDLALKHGWKLAFGNGRSATEVNDALFCLWVATINGERLKHAGIELNPWYSRIDRTVGREELSDVGHALALEIAAKHGQPALAAKLAKELRARAQKSGDRVFWTKAGFSRWGDNTTEVTATVMKALVAHDPEDPLIPGVLAYFHSTKRGDRWDSTKDTACVLYALCDYLAAVRAGPAATGIVKVFANGTEAGNTKLDSPASKVVKFAGADLKPGDNTFEVKGMEATGGALVRVSVQFTRTNGGTTPARDHGVKVSRTVSMRGADGKWTELKSGASVPVGSFVKVRVSAAPSAGVPLQYFLIESPKPAGAETISATDKRFPTSADAGGHVLREDREAMTCFHYERIGTANAEFVMLTEFAGEFTLPPARGELMYQPTNGGHSDSFVLKVTATK